MCFRRFINKQRKNEFEGCLKTNKTKQTSIKKGKKKEKRSPSHYRCTRFLVFGVYIRFHIAWRDFCLFFSFIYVLWLSSLDTDLTTSIIEKTWLQNYHLFIKIQTLITTIKMNQMGIFILGPIPQHSILQVWSHFN